jgi:hypothetical protein
VESQSSVRTKSLSVARKQLNVALRVQWEYFERDLGLLEALYTEIYDRNLIRNDCRDITVELSHCKSQHEKEKKARENCNRYKYNHNNYND